uniref:restriction endonuclease n=1 Tax=Ferrimicrobium acidiphilum TaxID=121039 RepID=UPI0023EFD7DC
LITTGSFTRDATLEATRDGAPPVELIDGDLLCDLLVRYQLGVITKERVEYDHRVDDVFFAEFR